MAEIKLTKEQVLALKKGQRDLHDVLTEVDKLENCGVACDEYRDMIKLAQERTQKILDNYAIK